MFKSLSVSSRIALPRLLCPSFRRFATAQKVGKVVVAGGAGGIGQPLSLLLKQVPEIKQLTLYDLVPLTKGVAVDLSHCDTPPAVEAFVGADNLHSALSGANIVVIPAGVPRKPGMTRDDLFNINAKIVGSLVVAAAKACPEAFLLVITNPVNSTVPIASAIRKRLGLSPKKLVGVTTLDTIRANTFVSQKLNIDVNSVQVPVIGGHAGNTIIPLLSHVPNSNFTQQDKETLTKKIAFAGDDVVAAKAGAGSATLSMAFAGCKFTKSVIRGMLGEPNVREHAYVSSSFYDDIPFFACSVELTPNGYENPVFPKPDDYEAQLISNALPQLKAEIFKGLEFGSKFAF